MTFSPYEFLDRKRRGLTLEPPAIETFIRSFVAGDVADYQMSAFLMAAAIHGLEESETSALTRAMLESGEQWRLRDRLPFVADKHSTGGVGDKVSLALAPLVAACGVPMAMLSGRGLGHTGGTLDKLEAIPGFDARLPLERLVSTLEKVGCVIATSTENIAPADRRMYALRDVTGTVESIPLITASIMSKKLALGASALILDVKFGSGAFMRTLDDARTLADNLVRVARNAGILVEALVTSMAAPLGVAIGNSLEVVEAFELLRGQAPADFTEVTLAQAERTLVMAGRSPEAARTELAEAIESGRAVEAAEKWVEAQGGDPKVVTRADVLARAPELEVLRAKRSGYVGAMDTRAIGMAVVALGGGRRRQDDELDPSVGLRMLVTPGAEVAAGDPLVEIHRSPRSEDPSSLLQGAIPIADNPPGLPPLIAAHIQP